MGIEIQNIKIIQKLIMKFSKKNLKMVLKVRRYWYAMADCELLKNKIRNVIHYKLKFNSLASIWLLI